MKVRVVDFDIINGLVVCCCLECDGFPIRILMFAIIDDHRKNLFLL